MLLDMIMGGVYMGFSFSMKIYNLSEFYNSMRGLNIQIGTFEHNYNDIISDVILDTRSIEQWKLIFIKHGTGEALLIPLNKGYRFTIDGNKAYKDFITYFKIRGGKGQFSIKDFITHFNIQVPLEYKLSDKKRNVIIKYDKIDSDSYGIYPVGLTNWEVAHAKNPDLPKDKYHRTNKNLLKTKELYPSIYEATKEMDISIIYGTTPGEKTDEIKRCRF